MNEPKRSLPIGAELIGGKGAHFRVWAPKCHKVKIVFSSDPLTITTSIPTPIELIRDDDGYFAGYSKECKAGLLYGIQLDDNLATLPDPASRFQPLGAEGMSQILDPGSFAWTDKNWKGTVPRKIVYEMHVGTFTKEGTWESAHRQLNELANIGINLIEIMPIAECFGDFNWGYDGVWQYAPNHTYGKPDDLKSFVNKAHQLGIAVILDVVYNHLGPGSEILSSFSPYYFTDKYNNEWGKAINFDGECSSQVREYFISNAQYWISEYHIDGLRIDATQQIFDSSKVHVLQEIVSSVKRAAKDRSTFIVAENEPQDCSLVRDLGLDALWNDDFHHVTHVALTSHNEAYYSDYKGSPQEFVASAKYGYLYQGQYFTWQNKCRGTPSWGLSPDNFVNFIQNHDQIANSCRGFRINQIASPAHYRAMTALLLLGPQIPMLFQGQEFGASTPFFFFAQHSDLNLADLTRKGRKQFVSQFESIAGVNGPFVPDPSSLEAFQSCKLDLAEREKNQHYYAMHKDLLAIRLSDAIFSAEFRAAIDSAVLGEKQFAIRYFAKKSEDDRVLVINLGSDLLLVPNPEPLLAPPQYMQWIISWHSEQPAYNGSGVPPLYKNGSLFFFGASSYFLKPSPKKS